MGLIDKLETRCHLAASPIHLDVPHTSGVDWNPNGTLRVIGTSKADQIQVIRADRTHIGEALENYLSYDGASGEASLPKPTQLHAIGPMLSPADGIHAETFGFMEGTSAAGFTGAFDRTLSAETERFIAVLVRGRLKNQCVLVESDIVTRVIVEGRRGNDVISSFLTPEEKFFTDRSLYAPVILSGGRGEDVLVGYLKDTMSGGAGNDRLSAYECAAMMGGAGDDFFVMDVDGVCELMNGGSGRDEIGMGKARHRWNIEVNPQQRQ